MILRCVRLGVLVAVALLIHAQNRYFEDQRGAPTIGLPDVQLLVPDAAALGESTGSGRRSVLDANDDVIGSVALTSPEGDSVTGYAGPTRSLLAFGTDGRIVGFKIVRSADTSEHVDKLLQSAEFMGAFDGLTEAEAAGASLSAVSGATLTAAATAGAIRKKLGGGGTGASTLFPDPPTIEDAAKLFEGAAVLEDLGGGRFRVFGSGDEVLGSAVRTSPEADAIIGYQGPTDVLVGMDPDGAVVGFTLIRSYDNDDYLKTFRYEPWFPKLFNGMGAAEVAAFDGDAVEGVSGATLSSNAIARGIVERFRALEAPAPAPPARPAVSWNEWGTILVVVLGTVIAFSKWRGNRRLRLVWQLVLVGYLGLVAGNLLAQSLLVGWSQGGALPWRLAPGLILLAAAALVLPWASGRNVYCHQICPHGAAQELVGKLGRWNLRIPAKADRILRLVPGVTLALIVVLALVPVAANIAAFEPFNAYLIAVAGIATTAIAIVGLVASVFTRLPYCKYGCPTGALLKFMRSGGSGDRWGRRDSAAILLLVLACLLFWQRAWLWASFS